MRDPVRDRVVLPVPPRRLALTVSFALIQGYERAPDAFWAVFPLGPAEIGGVAFGAFGICELLGRLLSWTKPNGPLPRFSDRRRGPHTT